ncbi:MAG TPA: hypothetical protein VE152_07125, partial [Acidimicrobiales bacterium]|nr:hypothetical protein [Acidimicrobiales bacterium]
DHDSDDAAPTSAPAPAPAPAPVQTASATSAPAPSSGYQNPLRGVSGLQPGRIDEGVDFGGSGPVYSLGNGTVTGIDGAGWPGGNFVQVQLSDGPDAGKTVYVAEDCTPQVSTGQTVTTGTVLCNMTNGPDGIEIGWAMGDGTDTAACSASYTEGQTTSCGNDMENLLTSLGVPHS